MADPTPASTTRPGKGTLAAWYTARPYAMAALTLLGVLFLLAWPHVIAFYSWQSEYYVKLFTGAAVSAVLVVSLNLCMGYGGLMSMMHTGLLAVGAYAVGAAAVEAGWSPWIGLVLAICTGAASAALVVLVSLRATALYFGMITLAANLLLIEIAGQWDSVTGGVNGITDIPAPSDVSTDTFYYVALGAVALAYVVQRNFVRSGAGRATMAVRESAETASALGIRPWAAKLRVFTLAGALGGFAGGLYAVQNTFVSPGVGAMDNGLVLFVGLMLGGIGTLSGPILGVALAQTIDYYTRDQGTYRTLIMGCVLLVAMMVMPRGIVGTWRVTPLGREVVGEPDDVPVPDEVPGLADPGAGPEPGEGPVLAARGIVKRFGGLTALAGVDLAVRAGTVHGVMGPNGSGKSTLMSCLTHHLRADEGTVLVDGRPAPRTPAAVAAAGVTRVFQIPHLFAQVSALDNVLTGMYLRSRHTWAAAVARTPGHRREDRTQREEARDLLAFAGLGGRADWPADALSHGQKRLLEVARAVATRPRVLILDEPATGLTAVEVDALARLVRALRERGLAVVLIEHNVEFVMRVCDVITVLDGGRVIAEGTPAQVRDDPAVLRAYLGDMPPGHDDRVAARVGAPDTARPAEHTENPG
ncbi:hypothetical protein B4N89_00565 [Embleya scabrispora]|uniref:ABC transporter domain-containing protein n=1 Tax=Embleya scabrispora TaxID=159449 RepID=A0A1T3NRW0_9ACTN|nr:branched-chain amino acid ABC transporter ATP-binding protein/permease [Embleya scabrispora]OPC79637.1 hypothetical protein B4N89_00565 [Embleya scabrispora]